MLHKGSEGYGLEFTFRHDKNLICSGFTIGRGWDGAVVAGLRVGGGVPHFRVQGLGLRV